MRKVIAIAAGGTGGHIFPAQAICQLLNKRYDILWFTDIKGKKFIKPITNSQIIVLPVRSIQLNIKLSYGLTLLGLSIFKAAIKLIRNKVKLVIGFGGYPAAPVLAAASILRIPIMIHEQNAVMGKVNLYFAKYAKTVITSFENTIKAPSKAIYLGNPVRQQITEAAALRNKINRKAEDIIRLLIIGGSQGSALLCNLLPEAIKQLDPSLRAKLHITQQTRPELIEQAKLSYPELVGLTISDFFEDIGERMATSHLIIARAGAATITELALLKKPAILIPLAIAKDNHQYYNAKYLADKGSALILEENNLTSTVLAQALRDVVSNLQDWTKKAESLSYKPNTLANMVTKINQLIM